MNTVNTVVGALLPLIVTLALGFFAAWHHDFTPAQASVLNRMVLLYALPLLLFASTVTIKRSTLTSDLGLAAAIAAGMLGTYLVTYLIVQFALHRPVGVSALTALAVGAPAIPFAGVLVIGYLYGPSLSAVPIAVGALVFNVIEVPATLVLLSADAGSAAAEPTRAAPQAATAVTQEPRGRPTLAPRHGFAAGGAGQVATAMQAPAAPAPGSTRSRPRESGPTCPVDGEGTRRLGAGSGAGAHRRRCPGPACAHRRDEAPGDVDHRRRIVRRRQRAVRMTHRRDPILGGG